MSAGFGYAMNVTGLDEERIAALTAQADAEVDRLNGGGLVDVVYRRDGGCVRVEKGLRPAKFYEALDVMAGHKDVYRARSFDLPSNTLYADWERTEEL